MKKIILLCLSFVFGLSDELKTVAHVDLERYLGKWYEIARYDHRFERGCSEVEAIYTLRDDGMIGVQNRCFIKDENRTKEAHGRAKIVDEQTNSKLKVTFFWPFYGDYWIIELAEDYRFVVVSEPTKAYFWILSRTPSMEQTELEGILGRAKALGFDEAKLIWRQ